MPVGRRDKLVRTLAEGGMGRVDLVLRTQGEFQRLFAVKRLRPALSDDAELRSMFLREARLAGLIRHPNVAAVQEVGSDRSGPYLVMDYVEGVTAASLCHWCTRTGNLLPVQLAVEIVRQAAEGLSAAHRLTDPNGRPLCLVHRDVSPQNILIGFDGVVRVTDFGIAKALDGGSKTSTGMLKGKLGYMAPEQLRFDPVDHRADLFSLGVVLFELLAARRLYSTGDLRTTARQILDDPPPDIDEYRDDVSPALVQLSFELLAKRPERRPEDAHVVARRLAAVGQELADEEGVLRLDDFLRASFADVAETVRAEVAALTETHVGRALPRVPLRAALGAAAGLTVAGAIYAAVSSQATEKGPPSPPVVAEPQPSAPVEATAGPDPTAPNPAAARAVDGDADRETKVDPELEAQADEAAADEATRQAGGARAQEASTAAADRAAAQRARARRQALRRRTAMRVAQSPERDLDSTTWEWE